MESVNDVGADVAAPTGDENSHVPTFHSSEFGVRMPCEHPLFTFAPVLLFFEQFQYSMQTRTHKGVFIRVVMINGCTTTCVCWVASSTGAAQAS